MKDEPAVDFLHRFLSPGRPTILRMRPLYPPASDRHAVTPDDVALTGRIRENLIDLAPDQRRLVVGVVDADRERLRR